MTEVPGSLASTHESPQIKGAFAGVGAALGLAFWFFLFPLPLGTASDLISPSHPQLGAFLGFLGMLLVAPGALFVAWSAWGTEWRRALPLARVSPAILVWTIMCVMAIFPIEFAWFAVIERIFGLAILSGPRAPLGAIWVLGVLLAAPLAIALLWTPQIRRRFISA